jgi:hypothetical protein
MIRNRGIVPPCAWLALAFASSLIAGNPVWMKYYPPPEGGWVYTIEEKDSLGSGSGISETAGGSVLLSVRRTVSWAGAKADGGWFAAVSADSAWASAPWPESVNRFERLLSKMRTSVDTLACGATGASGSVSAPFLPVLFAVPDRPVREDEAWSVAWTVRPCAPFEGDIRISGTAVLYRVDVTDGDTVALCSLQLDARTAFKSVIREPFQSVTNTCSADEKGTGVVFFNVSRHRVDRAVFKWEGHAFVNEMRKTASYFKRSRMTVRLAPD